MELVRDSDGWYCLQHAGGSRLLLGRVKRRPIWTGAGWASQWESHLILSGSCKTTTWKEEGAAVDWLMCSTVSILRKMDVVICNSDWTKISEVE